MQRKTNTSLPTVSNAQNTKQTHHSNHPDFVWKLLDKYFEGPNAKYKLTQHHLQSYSDFIRYKIPLILQDFNGWKQSEVYNGESASTSSTKELLDGDTNPHARAHIFAGMSVLDVHRSCHDASTVEIALPTRLQLRHQMLEYSHIDGKPTRLITPNEARLRNLNYQQELTCEVTIVYNHSSALDTQGKSSKQFVQICTDNWYEHYQEFMSVFDDAHHSVGVEELTHVVQQHVTKIRVLCEKHNPSLLKIFNSKLDEYIEKGVSKKSNITEGIHYVCQKLATDVCPYIVTYEDVVLSKIPLMLHSPFCVLHNQPNRFLRDVGECPFEKGGYFVIRGKEKVIISQESYQRNIIQTKSTVMNAPEHHVPVSTYIQHTGDSKGVDVDQEEIFQAVINCSDDPRPPVTVEIHYKRKPYYHSGGGLELDLLRLQKKQMDDMRQFLPFHGLYVTIKNRKLEAIITDVPLFLLFRAMGPTDARTLTEQISDRDILECIIGQDLSSVERRTVPVEDSRALCGVDTLQEGKQCMYTPERDGDCVWLSFNQVVTVDTGTRLECTYTENASTRFRVVCVDNVRQRKHIKVRLPSPQPLIPYDALPQQVTVQGIGASRSVAQLVGCRYAKRYNAVVHKIHQNQAVLTYTSYTKTREACDPLLFEMLRPSILEGSFAVNNEIARDMVQREIHIEALQAQDATFAEIHHASSTDKLDALFRTMFTHLKLYTKKISKAVLLRKKQLFLGYMTKRLLYAYIGLDERHTSRDSYRLRRVQLSGEMLGDVFRYEYFQLQNKYTEYIRNGMRQQGSEGTFNMLTLSNVIRTNIFDSVYLTDRLQKSFMGKWGSKIANDADQKAYCQELIRLSYYGSLSYLRRVHKELPTTSKPGQKKGTSKAVGPRLLHASQYGMICPLETPDGGNIGKIKHLSTFAFVCPQMQPSDRDALMRVVQQFCEPVHTLDAFYRIHDHHKVIVDGDWAFNCSVRATVDDVPITRSQHLPPDVFVDLLRLMRRNGLLSPLISIAWNISRQEILLGTQEGRVMRPLLIVEHNMLNFSEAVHNNDDEQWTWEELLVGRNVHGHRYIDHKHKKMFHNLTLRYDMDEKAPQHTKQSLRKTMHQLRMLSGVMEYIDTTEIDTRMLCMHVRTLLERHEVFEMLSDIEKKNVEYAHLTKHNADTFRIVHNSTALQKMLQTLYAAQHNRKHSVTPHHKQQHPPQQIFHFTHCELHPSLMLGVMGMLIPFPEHSQAPRNQYSCHQAKQALGLYVSSFRKRLDHANHILHYPERALTGSRYMRYINNEKLNYGTNAIVAIMCYGGFNIEDSILINKGAVRRGLFQSSYYFTEEVSEKDAQNEKVFIGPNSELQRQYHTFDYKKVDSNTKKQGVLPARYMNQMVKEDDVLIEAYEEKRDPLGEGRSFTDYKRTAKKDGYVDHIFLSDDVKGRRVAKVTLRNVRVPVVGDKIASRSGQKGTIGALIDEEDMPFIGGVSDDDTNSNFLKGLKPDLILNPHAIPSRMTVGQLLESLSGVLGARLGCMPDSTPLCSNDTLGATSNPSSTLSSMMQTLGMHPHGNQKMYNGSTGEKMKGMIFIGPTYYQRLKQMPTDKYYYRRTGRADMVTRQPIGGRAQGGALKLGEMERDSLLSHGISLFTKEAFNEKSDGFHYNVERKSGDVFPPRVSDKVDTKIFTPLKRSTHFLSSDEDGGFREYIANDETDLQNVKPHADVVQHDVVQFNADTSKVNVPFATRLLTQECEAMGIGMHLVPENHYPTRVRMTGTPLESINEHDERNDVTSKSNMSVPKPKSEPI